MLTFNPVDLNGMLQGRLDDVLAERLPVSAEDLAAYRDEKLPRLRRALGLEPLPPRTDLGLQIVAEEERDGYRLTRLAYASRPDVRVAATLYRPLGEGSVPVVVSAHGADPRKKGAPFVQARGIAWALRGIATLVVDSPGGTTQESGERGELGEPTDPLLALGLPSEGVYVWDLLRALDVVDALQGLDGSRVAVCGEHCGAWTALHAFALDPRFLAAAAVFPQPLGERTPLPGAGDLASVGALAALRAGAPLLLVGGKPEERLAQWASLSRSARSLRIEERDGDWDFDRRSRELAAAFFAEHLQGAAHRPYLVELCPLTDGRLNAYEAGTDPVGSLSHFVGDAARSSLRFRDLLSHALREPYPQDFRAEDRLVAWGKYGRLNGELPGAVVRLHDSSHTNPQADSLALPSELDEHALTWLGLSAAEFLAQLLHEALPGGPEGWEHAALTSHPITAVIASVRTLVGSAKERPEPTEVVAEGRLASLCAAYLKLYRPSLGIRCSHPLSAWSDLLDHAAEYGLVPGARYERLPTPIAP